MIPSPRHIQTLILLLVQAAEQLACASPVARGRGWPDWKEWMPQGTPRLGLIGATSIIICMMCWFTAIKAVYLYNFLVSIRVWGGGRNVNFQKHREDRLTWNIDTTCVRHTKEKSWLGPSKESHGQSRWFPKLDKKQKQQTQLQTEQAEVHMLQKKHTHTKLLALI